MKSDLREKYLYKNGYTDDLRIYFTASLHTPLSGSKIGSVILVCIKNDYIYFYNGIQNKTVGELIFCSSVDLIEDCGLKMGRLFSNFDFTADGKKMILTNIITSRKKLWDYLKSKNLI